MIRKLLCNWFPMICAVCFCGCAQPKVHMSAPTRPSELDRLEPWIGKWEGTFEGTCMVEGESKKSSGTQECEFKWELDRRFMVERGTHRSGDGPAMEYVMAMSYCPGDQKYHSNFFSSWGETGDGLMWYNEAQKCWCMSWSGHDPHDGARKVGDGCVRFVDTNTIEYCWTEYDGWKMRKLVETKGTMKRKT